MWQGTDSLTSKAVYVEGPYASDSAASASAASLQGVESEAGGGLYAVSAPLRPPMTLQVNAVAGCLKATSGHGNINY